MNNKTYKQLEFEPYVEHGVAKLRFKAKPTKNLFPAEAQEMATLIFKLETEEATMNS